MTRYATWRGTRAFPPPTPGRARSPGVCGSRPVRKLIDSGAVAADLDRLERDRREDGGWAVDFPSYSAAAALEWRGWTTVNAVAALRLNGRWS